MAELFGIHCHAQQLCSLLILFQQTQRQEQNWTVSISSLLTVVASRPLVWLFRDLSAAHYSVISLFTSSWWAIRRKTRSVVWTCVRPSKDQQSVPVTNWIFGLRCPLLHMSETVGSTWLDVPLSRHSSAVTAALEQSILHLISPSLASSSFKALVPRVYVKRVCRTSWFTDSPSFSCNTSLGFLSWAHIGPIGPIVPVFHH